MEQGEKRVRTLVVDDSALFLETICSFLETLGNIEIVGTAANGRHALQQVERLRPMLVLMDMQMPEMNGIDATRHLRKQFPAIGVIMVSMHDNPEVRLACQAVGAHAFVPKNRIRQELPAEIERLFPSGG